MPALASQRKTLSIYDQLELIDDVRVKKLKVAVAAKMYGIGYWTAAKILKKEDDLRYCMQMNGNTNRKQKRQSVHKDFNEAHTQWFTQTCAHGATVTNHVIGHGADFDEFISFDDRTHFYGELTDTDITRGIKSDDQDFDEDDDSESVSSEVSESDKPVSNSLAALNVLEILTAYFEAKSSNPDDVLKMIYGLYESVHRVKKEISVESKLTDFLRKK